MTNKKKKNLKNEVQLIVKQSLMKFQDHKIFTLSKFTCGEWKFFERLPTGTG